jgi:hypothetical protein
MQLARILRPLIGLLILAAPAPATAIVFDPLTSAFPPNSCLPLSGQPVIYVGSFCDGVACPPAPLANPACDGGTTPAQVGLPGMLAVSRRAEITGGPTANARSSPGTGTILVTTSNPAFVAMELAYTTADLDLVSLGATALRVRLSGDISPAKPLWCVAMIEDFESPIPYSYARLEIAATAVGGLVLPLAAFVQSAPFPYSGVNTLTLSFRDCPVASCTGSYPGRVYSIGQIQIDTSGSTAAPGPTWGRLKAIYR